MSKRGRPSNGTESPCKHCGTMLYSYPSRLRLHCGYACRAAAQRAQRVNETDGTARCARCEAWKPRADFVTGRDGAPHSYCKLCSSEWFHERRGTPVEKRKPYVAQHRDAEIAAQRRKEQSRRYRQENKEKIALLNRLRGLKNRGAGPMPPKVELEAMKCLQDFQCIYCRASLLPAFHIDHKTPVSRGGGNDLENFQLTCPTCNMKKSARTHEEYSRIVGYVEPESTPAPFDVDAFQAAMENGRIRDAISILRSRA